jgi:hypothetical protein
LVATAFIPNPEGKPTVNHKDRVRTNNRVENLEWATMSEQQQHVCQLGRRKAEAETKTEVDLANFKDIEGFPNYKVSSSGQIYLARHDRLAKQHRDHRGYMSVGVSADGTKKRFPVHRLVAEAFIPNPEGKPVVNHKNGNPSDNRVENLEWVTQAENCRHAMDHLMDVKKRVVKCDLEGQVFAEYESIVAAVKANPGCLAPSITRACMGQLRHHHGFKWKYLDEPSPQFQAKQKRVCQYSLTDELIKVWDTAREAERVLGISHVGDAAKGKHKSAGGFRWRYLEVATITADHRSA